MAIKDRGFASMSKEERQRIARMGGKASGKKRKERSMK
jgi:general stress protein YciG